MAIEQWAKVKDLFNASITLDPEKRAQFLEEACAGDKTLLKEVSSLLASDDEAFLERPAFEVSTIFPETEEYSAVGHRLGPYKLIREIGRGGMGAVYLAVRDDDQYKKQVAVKLIKRGMDMDFVLARFRNERQILAGLDHPNIARLLDGGTTNDGLPYFIMEYVEGEPINSYAESNDLTISERLKLFREVCAAVSYAHQNLVVHRDIKPSNILVNRYGQPKLLDFGIAKVLQEEGSGLTDLTVTIMRVLTPEYASPEQVKGEQITTATDVYSLGVLLYELLTGNRPYKLKRQTTDEIGKAICEQEPERPSLAILGFRARSAESKIKPQSLTGRSRFLRGDLDNVVLKALRKEPQRRYATVEQFSEDIRRHLEGLPVIARKDTLPYRSAKFIQRNLSPLLAAATTALVGLALAALFWLFGSPAAPVNSVAVLPFAGAGGPEGQALSEGITDDLMNSLSRLPKLKVSKPSAAARYRTADDLSLSTVGRELGAEAVLTVKAIEQADRLLVTVELFDVASNKRAWVIHYDRTTSDILALQNEVTKDVAARLRLKLSGNDEKLLARRYTDNSNAYQAYLRGRHFWNQRTEESLNKSIEYFQKATEEDPGYALAYTGLADAYIILGFIVRPAYAYPKAEQNALRALQLDDTLAEAHTSLARVKQIYERNWAEAEKEYVRAIELNQGYAMAHLWYADCLIYAGRADEGFAEVRVAQELDPLSLIVNANYGIYLYETRQYDRAIEQSLKTLKIDARLAAGHYVLGESYNQKQMYSQAIEEYKMALQLGSGAPARGVLGRAYAESGDKIAARKILDQLIESSKQEYVPATAIAEVCAGLGDKDRAFKSLEEGNEERCAWMYTLMLRPELDSLRSDPRFTSLLQRMNLTM